MLYVVLLLFLFLVLFALEFFIPSGGLIGVCAGAALIAAIVVGFLNSFTLGMITLIVGLLLVPAAFATMVRVWPKTPMGRSIMGPPTVQEKTSPYEALMGEVGIAKTDLLPNGMIQIDGKRLDAVSTGVPIDKGSAVEVVSVDGGHIHVRPTNRQPSEKETSSHDNTPTLETPVESLGLDDLSDPLSS